MSRIPVVPKHTAMIDFLDLCQPGACIQSDTLDCELMKSYVDKCWTLVELEERGLSSRDIVEKMREAITEDGDGHPDYTLAIITPADPVAIKKEVADGGEEDDDEDVPAAMVLAKFEEVNGEFVEVETFDGGGSSSKEHEDSSELAYMLHLHLRLPALAAAAAASSSEHAVARRLGEVGEDEVAQELFGAGEMQEVSEEQAAEVEAAAAADAAAAAAHTAAAAAHAAAAVAAVDGSEEEEEEESEVERGWKRGRRVHPEEEGGGEGGGEGGCEGGGEGADRAAATSDAASGATSGETSGAISELAKEGTRVIIDGDSGVVFRVTPKYVFVIYDEKTWEGISHADCEQALNQTPSPLLHLLVPCITSHTCTCACTVPVPVPVRSCIGREC